MSYYLLHSFLHHVRYKPDSFCIKHINFQRILSSLLTSYTFILGHKTQRVFAKFYSIDLSFLWMVEKFNNIFIIPIFQRTKYATTSYLILTVKFIVNEIFGTVFKFMWTQLLTKILSLLETLLF